MATIQGTDTGRSPYDTSNRRAPWARCIVLALLFGALSAGCGGDKGRTSSGGGGAGPTSPSSPATGAPPVAPVANVVGPNLNGTWAGYYKSIEGNYQNLTATITHVGQQITITTSMPPGIVKKLVGKIDAVGNMLLYDQFDKEDWTTLYGPASSKSINLADFVFVSQSLSDTNILILKR